MIDNTNPSKTTLDPLSIDAVDALGNGLRLQFSWQVDRFGHRIFKLQNGACGESIGASIESDNSVFWPTSPPVQQLSIEPINQRPTALGVGATGSGHWSISVHAQDLNGQLGFYFDVALRPLKPAETCGSCYQLKSPLVTMLPLDGIANTLVETADATCTARPLAFGNRELNVAASPAKLATIRWAYFITTNHNQKPQ